MDVDGLGPRALATCSGQLARSIGLGVSFSPHLCEDDTYPAPAGVPYDRTSDPYPHKFPSRSQLHPLALQHNNPRMTYIPVWSHLLWLMMLSCRRGARFGVDRHAEGQDVGQPRA